MRQRILTPFTLAICLTFALSGCHRPAPPDPYLIGHVVAQTGSGREGGLQAVRGVQLAVEEWNADADNLIEGRKLGVLHADTGGDPKLANAQAARLAGVNRVRALLGGMTRDAWEGIAQAAGDYDLLAVGTAGDMPPTASVNAISLGLSPVERIKAIDRYLAEDLKATSVVIVADNRPAQLATAEALADTLRGRKVAVEQSIFADAGKDLPRLIAQYGPDGRPVVLVGNAAAVARWRSAAPKSPLLFAGEEAELWTLTGPSGDVADVVFAGSFAWADTKALKGFEARFREKFGAAPSLEAVAGYDSARLLFATAKVVRGFSTAKLRARLKEEPGFTMLSGEARLGGDRLVSAPVFLERWRGGRPEIIRRLSAEPTAR